MCGDAIHGMHALILGPLIIASTYYQWDWVLYALGGLAIVSHLMMIITGTTAKSALKNIAKDATAAAAGSDKSKYLTAPVRGAVKLGSKKKCSHCSK